MAARIRLPAQIRRGEPFEVRTLVEHVMETGQRHDEQGRAIPRRILNKFEARFNGQAVITMDLAPAIAANPYLTFVMAVNEPGTLDFIWFDDDGSTITARERVTPT